MGSIKRKASGNLDIDARFNGWVGYSPVKSGGRNNMIGYWTLKSWRDMSDLKAKIGENGIRREFAKAKFLEFKKALDIESSLDRDNLSSLPEELSTLPVDVQTQILDELPMGGVAKIMRRKNFGIPSKFYFENKLHLDAVPDEVVDDLAEFVKKSMELPTRKRTKFRTKVLPWLGSNVPLNYWRWGAALLNRYLSREKANPISQRLDNFFSYTKDKRKERREKYKDVRESNPEYRIKSRITMASMTFSYVIIPSLFYAIINEWIGLAPFLKSLATKLVPSLQGTPLEVAGWIGAGAVLISIYKALHKRWVQKKLKEEKEERRANPEGYQPFDVLAYKIFSGADIPEDVVNRHQEAITFIQNTEPDVNERKKRILKEWENFDRYIRASLDKGVYLRKEEIGSFGGFPFYPDNMMNRRASEKEKQRLFLVTHYAEVQKLQCEDMIKEILDSGEFLGALKETMRGKTSVPKPLMVSLKKIVESDIKDRKEKKKVASIRNSYYRRPERFRRRGLI